MQVRWWSQDEVGGWNGGMVSEAALEMLYEWTEYGKGLESIVEEVAESPFLGLTLWHRSAGLLPPQYYNSLPLSKGINVSTKEDLYNCLSLKNAVVALLPSLHEGEWI